MGMLPRQAGAAALEAARSGDSRVEFAAQTLQSVRPRARAEQCASEDACARAERCASEDACSRASEDACSRAPCAASCASSCASSPRTSVT